MQVARNNAVADGPLADDGLPELPDAVREAEEAIAALAATFVVWTGENLQAARAALAEAMEAPSDNQDAVHRIFGIAHDMKGQGGSFDYHLVTAIAGMLCDYVRDTKEPLDTPYLKVVEAHLSALGFVLDRAITGSGGEIGRKLEDKLRDITAKIGCPA